jgi:hypothetical protein
MRGMVTRAGCDLPDTRGVARVDPLRPPVPVVQLHRLERPSLALEIHGHNFPIGRQRCFFSPYDAREISLFDGLPETSGVG